MGVVTNMATSLIIASLEIFKDCVEQLLLYRSECFVSNFKANLLLASHLPP